MKRICIILIMVLSLSFVLSSCGSSSANEAPLQSDNNGNASSGEKSASTKNPTSIATDDVSTLVDDGSVEVVETASVKAVSENDWGYYFDGNGVTIYRYNGSDDHVTVPATLKIDGEDQRVTAIERLNTYHLKSVTIPDSVTLIGEKAFSGNLALNSVTISDSVTSIGGGSFSDTPWYQNQPDGPIYVGGVFDGFKGNQPIGAYDIKAGTKTIGRSPAIQGTLGWFAFLESVNLTSVTIPDGVTVIGNDAFSGCTGLTSITIPNSVTTIGSRAFSDCTGLTSITIPDSVTTIGDYAFSGCTGLTSITLPKGIASVGERAFGSTPWYRNLPKGPIYIGTILYDYKGSLPDELIVEEGTTDVNIFLNKFKSVTIPDSVTYIDSDGRISLATRDNWWTFQPDGPVYLGRVLYGYKGAMPPNTAFKINEGTVAIADKALFGLNTLTSVTIPDSVTYIGDLAFSECSGLTSITIPGSVTSIGASAFSNCTELTSVTIQDGVTTIKKHAFNMCTRLTSITIPYSVTDIGDRAFNTGSYLTIVAPSKSYVKYKLGLK